MDSNTKAFKQIDKRGKNDLERVIEELNNKNLIFEEKIQMQKKQLLYLQTQIRKYGKKNKS
jgi:hypothetical protein